MMQFPHFVINQKQRQVHEHYYRLHRSRQERTGASQGSCCLIHAAAALYLQHERVRD